MRLHVWHGINGPQKTRINGEYSIITRLICCKDLQRMTFGTNGFRTEDYTGICLYLSNLYL